MKVERSTVVGRCCLAAATLLAGGTVFGTCELRLRDALVSSGRQSVASVIADLAQDLGAVIAPSDDTTE